MKTNPPPPSTAPRSVPALWFCMLGPPLAWLTQFEIKYALASHEKRGGAMLVVSLLTLAFVAALGIASWGERKQARTSPLDLAAAVTGRNRFMATVGMMVSVLFSLLIIAQMIADFFFAPGNT